MTTNICTPDQYAAIAEIVRGLGYANLGAWLKTHGKIELRARVLTRLVWDEIPVLHVADALEVLEEAGYPHCRGPINGLDIRYWLWVKGKMITANSAAELLDKVLAEIGAKP